jgi:diguanylate cyclase (GGDEF)-like protein
VIVALYDEYDVLRFANEAYERRFLRGKSLPIGFADVLRHGFHNGFGVIIGSGDIEQFLKDILPRRRTVPYRAFEVDTLEGEWIWMTETLHGGWLLSIGSNITALKHNEHTLRQAHAQALQASKTDALTGIANRRSILEIAEGAVERHDPGRGHLSLAVIDIDHFKKINDTLGHDAGDEVLRHFAGYCSSSLRNGDRFGRLGGEEFLLLLPGASATIASSVLTRLRVGLSRNASMAAVPYTFSAGIAEALAGEGLATVIKRADRALYAAKASGRDRVEIGAADES